MGRPLPYGRGSERKKRRTERERKNPGAFVPSRDREGAVCSFGGNQFGPAHLERSAFCYGEDERGKFVAVLGGVVFNAAQHGHIVVIDYATQRIGKQAFGERSDERIGVIQNCLAQADG